MLGTANEETIELFLPLNGPAGTNTVVDYGPKQHSVTGSGSFTNSNVDPKSYTTVGMTTNQYGCVIPPGSTFALGTSDWTLEFWLDLHASPPFTWPYLMATSAYNVSGGMYCVVDGAGTGWGGPGKMSFILTGGAGSLSSVDPVRGQGWVHIAVVREGSEARFYLNGTLKDTQACSANLIQTGLRLFNAASTCSHGDRARMQDFRITRAALYGDNFTPPATLFIEYTPTILDKDGNPASRAVTILTPDGAVFSRGQSDAVTGEVTLPLPIGEFTVVAQGEPDRESLVYGPVTKDW